MNGVAWFISLTTTKNVSFFNCCMTGLTCSLNCLESGLQCCVQDSGCVTCVHLEIPIVCIVSAVLPVRHLVPRLGCVCHPSPVRFNSGPLCLTYISKNVKLIYGLVCQILTHISIHDVSYTSISHILLYKNLYNNILLYKNLYNNILLHKFLYNNISLHKFLYNNISLHKFLYNNILLHKFLYNNILLYKFLLNNTW